MRTVPALITCVLAACKFEPHLEAPRDGDDGVGTEKPIDVMGVEAGPCDGTLFGTGTFTVCVTTPAPNTTVTLTSIVTDVGDVRCQSYTSSPMIDACVVVGTTINIGVIATATGTKPLILLSTGGISIMGAGKLDAASHGASMLGAGADQTCTAGNAATYSNGRGGGAAGGSFGGPGGPGGDGNDGSPGSPGPTTGTPMALRGGCLGATGGDAGHNGGAGGHSGGVVAMIAKGKIQIDGDLNASGAGGRGAADSTAAGGGGGGSGGMILLDAPTVAVAGGGHVWANGGGGGAGAGLGSLGGPGGESTAPNLAGGGGVPGATGGVGGIGSVSGTAAGLVGQQGTGGGGGGGGAGIIVILATTKTGTTNTNNVAPPPR